MWKYITKLKNLLSRNGEISTTQMIAYGAGGIIPIALFNSVGILIGLLGNISLGLSAFWLGFILIIPRLWDAISDPFIGHLSDNTRTKWGRRRPFLLWGGILTAIFFVILWWIPKGETVEQWFATENSYQAFQLAYILVTLLLFFTAINLFEIPHGALGMEITTDYHLRTRLFSIKSLIGNFFAVITPWLFWLANRDYFKGVGGTTMDGMRYVSLLIGALLIPLSVWWFTILKEPKFVIAKTQQKTDFWKDMKIVVTNRNFVRLTLTVFTLAMGFNFVSLLGSYIPIFYIFGGNNDLGSKILGINGTVWAITGMIAVFPLNIISPKLGKRNTLLIAILLMITAQLSKIFCYNPEYPYLIIIPTILLSAGMLFFFTLGSSMVGDICDEEELKTGKRSEGSFYSVFWWFIKMGTALASFVAGALIVFTMFDENQVTKVDKLESQIKEFVSLIEKTEFDKEIDFKTLQNESIKETDEFIKLLNKDFQKKQENTHDYNTQKIILIQSILPELNKTSAYWQTNPFEQDSIINSKSWIPHIFNTKINKLKYITFELQNHFENKIDKVELNNSNHYQDLFLRTVKLSNLLKNIKTNAQLNDLKIVSKEFKKEIISLKKQTPYTLLMMRIVEIGIPVLLSIISILFLMKYTLTEKKSLEIKELLKQKML